MVGCDVDALAGNIKEMLLWTTKEFLVMQKKKTQTWLISMLSIFMNEGGSWRKEEQSWSSHQVQKGEQQHQEGYEGKENWIKDQFLKIDGIEWQEKRRTSFWSSSLQQVYRKLSLKWSPHKQQDCAKLIDLALQQLTQLLSEGRPQHLSEQRDYNQWPGIPVSLRLREPYAAWREGSHPGLMNIPAVMLKHGREDTVKTLTTLAENLGKLRGALLIDAIAYHTPSQERQK